VAQRPKKSAVFLVLCGVLLTSKETMAGAWIQPSGSSFLKVAFLSQETTERYFLDGDRIPYFFEGRNETRAVFFEYARGITDRIDVCLQLPVYRISFDDLANDRTSTGAGDLRVEARYNVLKEPVVFTLGGGVKFPTGEFVNDAEIVPVGEGQYDVDVFGELARSLWPLPGYVSGRLGYRFRGANDETNIDFGDEIVYRLELGMRALGGLDVKTTVHGLYGLESTSFGLTIDSLRREALYLEPGASYVLGDGRRVEVSVPFTIRGRNWPAGPVLSVGFTQTF
jgi:hypothetical protein